MRIVKMLTFTLTLLLSGLPCSAQSPKQSVSLLKKPGTWIETGADNSLTPTTGLFVFSGNKSKILGTDSEATNIHAHYAGRRSSSFNNYVYSGQMRIADESAGIGVTFYSDYLTSDSYYRLRRYSGEPTFHIAPHGTEMSTESCDTLVDPLPGTWYNFKVLVKRERLATRVRAKVWAHATKEPKRWQANCLDTSGDRIWKGRPGVWSAGRGRKEWRSLSVRGDK